MTTDESGGVRNDGDQDHGDSKSTPPSQSSQPRRSAGGQGTDVLNDFQRWLVRVGARNVRSQISGQVRRKLGSGKTDAGDVWNTATTEPPLAEGESPECQWCPICRAARRMRESGPGLGEHLLTAGEAVAAAMQDSLGALSDRLSRPAGSAPPSASERASSVVDAGNWAEARDQWAAQHGARPATAKASPAEPAAPPVSAAGAGSGVDAGADGVVSADDAGRADGGAEADRVASTDSVAGADEAAAAAQDVTSEPDGTDEPDDRS